MHSFDRLDLMRCRLKWAYERPLADSTATHYYIESPTVAWLVRKGTITVEFEDGGAEVFTPGEWVFPREGRGTQSYRGGLEILSIRFHALWSHGELLFPRGKTVRIPESQVPGLTQAAERLVASVREGAVVASDWQLAGKLSGYWTVQRSFLDWMLEWHAAMTAHGIPLNPPDALDVKVRAALEWMEAQPLDTEFRETALAQRVGISVSQLNKLFTAQTGATSAAHWQRRRIEVARNLLISSAESIKAIAYELGFSSPEYFTTWFRKHHGIAPTALRRKYAGMDASGPWV